MVYRVTYKTFGKFIKALEAREWDLIEKTTSQILLAVKKQKVKIQLFEVFAKDEDVYYDHVVEKKDYKKILEISLEEYIKKELYLQCVEIKKAIDSL